MAGGADQQRCGTVLIVESEPLLRWSLVTYLSRWFDVIPTAYESVAHHTLEDQCVDAVVVSDDLCDQAAEGIEAHALSRNAAARVIRTITNPSRYHPFPLEAAYLEKPFQLSRLAVLLGISEVAALDESETDAQT
jgi:hypothetical protein